MPSKRIHRSIPRSEQQRRELAEIRRRFSRERPSLEDLVASGDAAEVVSLGEYLDLLELLATLKASRQRQGLSLADIAERSGMDRAAISRLENGAYLNPTLDTLYRYARAVGAEIGFSVRAT